MLAHIISVLFQYSIVFHDIDHCFSVLAHFWFFFFLTILMSRLQIPYLSIGILLLLGWGSAQVFLKAPQVFFGYRVENDCSGCTTIHLSPFVNPYWWSFRSFPLFLPLQAMLLRSICFMPLHTKWNFKEDMYFVSWIWPNDPWGSTPTKVFLFPQASLALNITKPLNFS